MMLQEPQLGPHPELGARLQIPACVVFRRAASMGRVKKMTRGTADE